MRSDRLLIGGLAALTAAAPLLIGGVHPRVQLVLSTAAWAVTAGYVLFMRGKDGLRWTPFLAVAALAQLATLLSLLPWPSGWVAHLSPHALELRTDAAQAMPRFLPLTLDVPATILELMKGFSYLGLLAVTAGFARSSKRARSLLWPIALVGGAVAFLALVQRLIGAESILGLYVPRNLPGSGFFGTFVNGNHAASLLSLGALVALGLAFEASSGGGVRLLSLVCAALSGGAVAYTQSRAGTAGLACGGLLLALIALTRRFGSARGALLAIGLWLGLGTALYSLSTGLRTRAEELGSTGALTDNQKVRGWKDAVSLTRDFPLSGVGRGAVEAPLGGYRVRDEAVRLVYPENLLIQMAAEWGLPVTILLLLLWLIHAARLAPYLARLELGCVGAAAGVLAVLVHEMADFGLEMFGVAIPTVIALGVVTARSEELRKSERSRRTRLPLWASASALGGWFLALGGAAWAASHTLDADTAQQERQLKAKAPGAKEALDAAILRHPADDILELYAARAAMRGKDMSAVRHLNRALRLHPANWQGHQLAARYLAQRGSRQQAALEYRLAIEAGFPPPYDELLQVLGAQAVEAIPRESGALMTFAQILANKKRPEEAAQAAMRAVELGEGRESLLVERVHVAVRAGGLKEMAAAANALLGGDGSAASLKLAAETFERAKEPAQADRAIERGRHDHPEDATLVLTGVRLHLERGDLTGARARLSQVPANMSLADRQLAEELLAQVAERSGAVEEAMGARARARLIARKREMPE